MGASTPRDATAPDAAVLAPLAAVIGYYQTEAEAEADAARARHVEEAGDR